MTGERRESEVEVGLDPDTAFAVFTEELDYWWLRGPINNWDSARVCAMRCEPGLGGRLLEIYDETAGDMLELARITAWEPGQRLAWRSSVDDVAIEVRVRTRRCRDPSAPHLHHFSGRQGRGWGQLRPGHPGVVHALGVRPRDQVLHRVQETGAPRHGHLLRRSGSRSPVVARRIRPLAGPRARRFRRRGRMDRVPHRRRGSDGLRSRR